MNMMTVKEYKEKFEELTDEVKKLKHECKHLQDLEDGTKRLSRTAAAMFKAHAALTEEGDYHLKKDTYIGFENLLTEIKREFKDNPPPKNRRASFFSRGQSAEDVKAFYSATPKSS